MADTTITAANVIPPADAKTFVGTAGEAGITAGMILYFKPSDLKWYKADANTAEKAGTANDDYIRVALGNAGANQPVVLLAPGQDLTVNAALSPGRGYAVSATATSGAWTLESNLVNGDRRTTIGFAKSTTVLRFEPRSTGVVLS